MKLLFAYPFCGLGGIETATITRAHALIAEGNEAVVSFRQFYGDGGRELATKHGVVVQDDERLIAAVRNGSFDAVVAIDFPELVGELGKRKIDVPVIFETHSGHAPTARRFTARVNDPLVRGVVVPARLNRRRVLRVTGTGKPVVVVPNPVDLARFSLRREREVRRKWGPLADRKVVAWIGRLEDLKNPREAIEIAARVAADDEDAAFVIVGDSPGDPASTEAVQNSVPASLGDRFEFRTFVPFEDMPLLYSLAAVTGGCLLSTSLAEASPMTFLEAMACECPIVSSQVEGIEALVPDGSRGLLYELGDIAGGVTALRSVLDPARASSRQAIIDESRAYVTKHHSPRRVARRFVKQVEGIIGTDLRSSRRLRLQAIITASDDEAVIARVVEHLVEDGVDVYLIDDGSRDDTGVEAARWLGRGLIGLESPLPPQTRKAPGYESMLLGRRKKEIWKQRRPDWCLEQRGNEISHGPWPGLSLAEAIAKVDELEFNAIAFRILEFAPADVPFHKGADPAAHFRAWKESPAAGSAEVMAWKRGIAPAARKVFPLRFLTCRYPVGTAEPEEATGELRQFDLERVRLETILSGAPRSEAFGELARLVRVLRETVDTEAELMSSALKLASRRRSGDSRH